MQGNTISGGCGGKRLCVPPYIKEGDIYYDWNGQIPVCQDVAAYENQQWEERKAV